MPGSRDPQVRGEEGESSSSSSEFEICLQRREWNPDQSLFNRRAERMNNLGEKSQAPLLGLRDRMITSPLLLTSFTGLD